MSGVVLTRPRLSFLKNNFQECASDVRSDRVCKVLLNNRRLRRHQPRRLVNPTNPGGPCPESTVRGRAPRRHLRHSPPGGHADTARRAEGQVRFQALATNPGVQNLRQWPESPHSTRGGWRPPRHGRVREWKCPWQNKELFHCTMGA
jgi:hypothetical protein